MLTERLAETWREVCREACRDACKEICRNACKKTGDQQHGIQSLYNGCIHCIILMVGIIVIIVDRCIMHGPLTHLDWPTFHLIINYFWSPTQDHVGMFSTLALRGSVFNDATKTICQVTSHMLMVDNDILYWHSIFAKCDHSSICWILLIY